MAVYLIEQNSKWEVEGQLLDKDDNLIADISRNGLGTEIVEASNKDDALNKVIKKYTRRKNPIFRGSIKKCK